MLRRLNIDSLPWIILLLIQGCLNIRCRLGHKFIFLPHGGPNRMSVLRCRLRLLNCVTICFTLVETKAGKLFLVGYFYDMIIRIYRLYLWLFGWYGKFSSALNCWLPILGGKLWGWSEVDDLSWLFSCELVSYGHQLECLHLNGRIITYYVLTWQFTRLNLDLIGTVNLVLSVSLIHVKAVNLVFQSVYQIHWPLSRVILV